MTTLTQLYGGGSGPVASLQRAYTVVAGMNSNLSLMDPLSTLSGAMTAGTPKTLLSVTGRGRLQFSALVANDATARNLTPVIEVDGTNILPASALSFSSSGAGIALVGAAGYATDRFVNFFEDIDFQVSLAIKLTSSLTETDKATLYYRLQVWQ